MVCVHYYVQNKFMSNKQNEINNTNGGLILSHIFIHLRKVREREKRSCSMYADHILIYQQKRICSILYNVSMVDQHEKVCIVEAFLLRLYS